MDSILDHYDALINKFTVIENACTSALNPVLLSVPKFIVCDPMGTIAVMKDGELNVIADNFYNIQKFTSQKEAKQFLKGFNAEGISIFSEKLALIHIRARCRAVLKVMNKDLKKYGPKKEGY